MMAMRKYIICVMSLLLLISSVCGYQNNIISGSKGNSTNTPICFFNGNDCKYVSYIANNLSKMSINKSYIAPYNSENVPDPILLFAEKSMSYTKSFIDPINDSLIIKNKDRNFKGKIDYYQRFWTSYGDNETIIYGDAKTGKLLAIFYGDHGTVGSGIPTVDVDGNLIPKRTQILVAHTHPDPIPGAGWIYNPVFSVWDRSNFANNSEQNIVQSSIITSGSVATTNVIPIDVEKSIKYDGYAADPNWFTNIIGYNQQKQFAKEGMTLKVTPQYEGY